MLFLGVIAALQLFALPTKGNAIQIPLLSDPNPPTPLNASQIHEFKVFPQAFL